MERKVNYVHVIPTTKEIPIPLYEKLDKLGLIPNEVRKGNIGASNYAEHTIQPWSVWIDYDLNPWDADIVKRVLRTKEESGMTEIDARIMDYNKIKHICDERIRQLELQKGPEIPKLTCKVDYSNDMPDYSISIAGDLTSASILKIPEEPTISYHLKGKEIERYNEFCEKHKHCPGSVRVMFSHESGMGVTVRVWCPFCDQSSDITDFDNW